MCASVVACKTREVGSTPAARGGLVFSDDFERSNVGDDWQRGSGEGGGGEWRIVDGWLRGKALKNDPLWLTQPLPRRARIEFDARALSPTGDLKVEVFGDGENHASGYILIFGGWDNTLDVIARLDEHGDDRKARSTRKVKPRNTYAMAVERSGGTIKWFVDDELFMTYHDDEPLTGPKHAHFAFSNWMAPVEFDNVRVFRLK
jgi:hypothetical protein